MQKVLYWRDRKFHEEQTFNYFYCGPDCSMEHYDITAKEKIDKGTTGENEFQGAYSNPRESR